ncbi:putative C3HC zinc finger-like-domain-containing protein [Seiridium cardinale]|uniref:C3HC zinc finger-like-domain-containing protein n=1 Tax=Seiridium cardinale TaxID=138064 RepID=A0ABR2X8F5_9PEZI
MNATKRKFNALIQGMGTKSTPQPDESPKSRPATAEGDPFLSQLSASNSPSSAPQASTDMAATTTTAAAPLSSISADFLAKRRRMGALGSVTGNESAAGKMTIKNITLKKWTPAGKEDKSAGSSKLGLPKYCPGDREQLIRRLGTFQELTQWTPKPDKVNEIEWAKRGWVCRGKETVQCTLCHKELVVNMKKKEVDGKETSALVGSDLEGALVKKFAELVVEAHQEDCLWRKRGCDDSLLRLQITSAQAALPALRQRYDELCARPAFLPYDFNLRLPESLSLETVKSQLPPKFFTEPPPTSKTTSTKPNDVALALALAGWGGLTNPKIGPVPNSASCSTCLRRLGLWMFKSKEVNQETGEILVPAPMDHLDPVREHRFFCPWRNPSTQRNPGSKASEPSKAAWEILVLTVRNATYLRGDTPRKDRTPAHERSKSTILPGTLSTPKRHVPTASESAIDSPLLMLGPDMVEDEEEDEKTRDAKDKERWARLRRVKSLFNTKNGRKRLSRTLSRPGTAKSNTTTGETGEAAQDQETTTG